MKIHLLNQCLFLLLIRSIEANYGGKYAYDGQFPYVALLTYNSKKHCGASIIHERWAFTAAHCVNDESKTYMLTVGTPKLFGASTTYKVEKCFVHPDFDVTFEADGKGVEKLVSDIALVRVASKITFNNSVHPIALATDKKNKYTDSMATMAGWGSTDPDEFMQNHLHFIRTHVVSKKSCRKAWSFADKNSICTSTMEGQGACLGDSGSPLVVKGIQIGQLTISNEYCSAVKPDFHTKVAGFVPWIRKTLARYGDVLPDS